MSYDESNHNGIMRRLCHHRVQSYDVSTSIGRRHEQARTLAHICFCWIVCDVDNCDRTDFGADAMIRTESGTIQIFQQSRFWDIKAPTDIKHCLMSVLLNKNWSIWTHQKKSGSPRDMIAFTKAGIMLKGNWDAAIQALAPRGESE